MSSDKWFKLLEICVPVLVALVPLIPTIIASASKTGKKLDKVEAKLDAHIKDDEWAQAKQRRVRILRFNDEICSGVSHSENHFEEILEDIDEYEKFCESHKDYKNNKGRLAMEHIQQEYQKHKDNQDFLI